MTESVNWGALMDQAGDFTPVPPNDYDVYVDSAEAKLSSTGKTMFALRFKIEGGPMNGRTLFNNITLTTDNPNALRMFFLNMQNLGLTKEFFAQQPPPSSVAQALLGKRCRVKVSHRPYQGQMRENVDAILPGVGIGSQGVVPTPGAAPGIPAPVAAAIPQVPAPVAAPAPVQPPAPPAPIAEQPPAAPVFAEPAPAPIPAPVAQPVEATAPAASVPPPPPVPF